MSDYSSFRELYGHPGRQENENTLHPPRLTLLAWSGLFRPVAATKCGRVWSGVAATAARRGRKRNSQDVLVWYQTGSSLGQECTQPSVGAVDGDACMDPDPLCLEMHHACHELLSITFVCINRSNTWLIMGGHQDKSKPRKR